ncbi:Uncharacterised protein [Mycobacteroides abscessus subsp. abscessus]|nr:Uncharacterised protein [Mycobacteroides abscessus subsp. abscessus]
MQRITTAETFTPLIITKAMTTAASTTIALIATCDTRCVTPALIAT